MNTCLSNAVGLIVAACSVVAIAGAEPDIIKTLQTEYAKFMINNEGFIVSIKDRTSNKESCPMEHPSPILTLHESGTPSDVLVMPQSASCSLSQENTFHLKYANGATAVVQVDAVEGYLRLKLLSLEPRGTVDNIVWGPINTNISEIIGDIIGVVRSTDWAIGLFGLDDNTIAGPVADGDCYGMGYYIHSPDPVKYPIPSDYKEGQWFNIGGNGISDTAFYSHPEEYFRQVFGNGAKLEPDFGSTIAYHSRDRRKSYVHFFSLLPGFPRSRPRHMVSDPVEGVDFLGSAVALYACPDNLGLATLETIFKNEGLIFVTDEDGKWVRNPAAFHPTVYWNGPVDKAIEYAKAMGFKDISRNTGEFYSSRPSPWVGNVGYSDGKSMTYKEFGEEAHKHGLTHGGLHTLCMFLQGGISSDVTPVPSEHLQTVCRTKLARDISPTDTEIVVTDPSFLAEQGTWTMGDESNYLRIGGEMLRYDGISDSAPWTLKGVKRGHASKAVAHKAGDELVKLMQNCYNGFVPDMTLMLDYVDDYIDLMVRNRMDAINFDGYECLMYQNHGYYAMKVFNRRLFEGYHKRTGRWPRVTGSNAFSGAWEFMNVCDVGGGNHMFNAFSGRRGIEGKDIGNGYGSSWFPGTFGSHDWHSNWSLYDAENLMGKAVGWEATFALSTSQEAIDATGEKEAIFKSFKAWQEAREQQVFSNKQKEILRDPDFKAHLEQTGEKTFMLYWVKEIQSVDNADNTVKQLSVTNPYDAQPLEFSLQFAIPADGGAAVTLPDGQVIKCGSKIDANQFIVCKDDKAYLADRNRTKLADLTLFKSAVLPKGESQFGVQLDGSATVRTTLTVFVRDTGEKVGK